MTHRLLLAQKSGEAVKAGPIGLAVILILAIGCYFLFKSMSRHLKNVRENFPADPTAPTVPVRPTRPPRSASQARAAGALPTATVVPNPAAVDAVPLTADVDAEVRSVPRVDDPDASERGSR